MHSDWTKSIEMTEILFVRHAESFNNVLYDFIRKQHGDDVSEEFLDKEEERLRQPDSSLSENGCKQIQLLQTSCENGLFSQLVDETNCFRDWIVLSSPMRRCLLTSQAFAKGLKLPIYVHPRLYESGGCYAMVEGKQVVLKGSTKQEVESEYNNYRCLPGMEDGWYANSDSIESFAGFKTRAQTIVDLIWSLHHTPKEQRQINDIPFHNLIIVIHGNLLNAVITGLQGIKDSNCLVTHNNTGCTRIQLLTAMKEGYCTPEGTARHIHIIYTLILNIHTCFTYHIYILYIYTMLSFT